MLRARSVARDADLAGRVCDSYLLMCREMDWTNATVMRFLKLYQMNSCIWDPKNLWYRNRNRRNKAWNDIKNNMDEPCTVKELKQKRASLMSAYRGYRCKIKKSENSGTGNSEVYKPTWYAYSLMDSFLGDVYKCNLSIKTEKNPDQHVEEDSNSGQDDTADTNTIGESDTSIPEQKVQINFTNQASLSPQQSSTAIRFKRRLHHPPEIQLAKKQMDQALNILKSVSQKHQEDDDECSIFGKLIAKKMRKLPEDRRDLMMIKINKLFYEEHIGSNSSPSMSFDPKSPSPVP